VTSTRDDLVDLSDFAFDRLRTRMRGLTDEEYLWEPVPDCRTIRPDSDGTYRSDGPARPGDTRVFTTLAWRLCHVIYLFEEDRNGPWLGVEQRRSGRDGEPGTASAALTALDEAYAGWRAVLEETTDESLQERIGPVGRNFGDSTRRAFVLHVLDELIHHGAEAALMRDLYAARPGSTVA
jgi:uncharacterized damage-inducible protein DinB